MYLENTRLAPKGSWRKAKIESALIFDIACAMALNREGDDSNSRVYEPEAEIYLHLFINKLGRYPVDCTEVDEHFPDCFKPGFRKPRLVVSKE
jgi:hypothetical protein